MMFNRNFTVKFKPIKNNFVLIPDSYQKLLSAYRTGCLVLSFRNSSNIQKTVYVGYITQRQSVNVDNEEDIGMSSLLAKNMGLREGSTVVCSFVPHVSAIKSCQITSQSSDDHIILETSAEVIRNSLLNQINVVNKGQILTIYINNNLPVNVVVDSLNPPFNYGKLQNDSELIIKEPPNYDQKKKTEEILGKAPVSDSLTSIPWRRRLEPQNNDESDPRIKRNSFIERSATEDFSKLRRNSSFTNSRLLRDSESPKEVEFKKNMDKANAFESILNQQRQKIKNTIMNKLEDSKMHDISEVRERERDRERPLTTSASVSNIPIERVDHGKHVANILSILKKQNKVGTYNRVMFDAANDSKFTQITDMLIPKTQKLNTNQNFVIKTRRDKQYAVHPKIIEMETIAPDMVEVNSTLAKLLDVNLCEKVHLQPLEILTNVVEKIEIIPPTNVHQQIARDIEEKFKKYIVRNTRLMPLVLNNNQLLKLGDYNVKIELHPTSLPFCQIDAEFLRNFPVEVSPEKCDKQLATNLMETITENCVGPKETVLKFSKYDEIVKSTIQLIGNILSRKKQFFAMGKNFLISGTNDSGKTMICKEMKTVLEQSPFNVNVTTINCSKYKGKKPDSLVRDLREIFNSCLQATPSIVVLLNLDSLAQITNEEHHTQDDEYYKRITDFIRRLVEEYEKFVIVLATVEKCANLNKRLFYSHGFHLFKDTVKIPNLEKVDREEVLARLLKNFNNLKIDKNINWNKFINLTEGFSFGDIKSLFDRAIFFAIKKNPIYPFLNEELLRKSLEISNKLCMYGIRTGILEDEDYTDNLNIFGMENVIRTMEEVLLWPSKFPMIFKNSPIRNQAGILLYGIPGSGKTFAITQIAKKWNLRMISIKGPELLAKYIGQSEENVRSLFEKAKNSKPCVIFFDEFDSLAPRRGHDSTGVTDRVVNQLLTELDGVKSLEGVFVLGATSRPDLLDPALLRSGRIDRIVQCKMPNAKDRRSIIENICQNVNIDSDFDINLLTKKTNNFTGADIKSLLTTANMLAIESLLQKNLNTLHNLSNVDRVVVEQRHLMQALESTKPSLNERELKKYEKLYENFVLKTTVNTQTMSKKISLA